MTFDELRQTLIEALEERLDFNFQPGEIPTPNPDYDIGCIFLGRAQPYGASYSIRQNQFTVRVLLKDLSGQVAITTQQALDPVPLETAVEQAMDAIKTLQVFEDGYIVWLRTDYRNTVRTADLVFETRQNNDFNQGG